MSHSVLYIPSVFRKHKDSDGKPELSYAKADFKWPLLFLLSLALVGLHFYPAVLFVLAIILKRWREDRYDAAIMIFLVLGCYGSYTYNTLGVKMFDVALIAAVLCMFLLKKPPVLRKVLILFALYATGIILIAMQSWESMGVQVRVMRYYFSVVTLFIPLAVFADTPFDIDTFFRRLMPFILLACIFYIIDGFILRGDILMPSNYRYDGGISTFYHPLFNPLGALHRKYPYGLYILGLAIVPALRYYRLRPWMWIVVILAAMSTQTFTFISGIFITAILFQGSVKRFLKFLFAGIFLAVALYTIDCFLPEYKGELSTQSTLRIKSSVDQIVDLFEFVDDEDLAKFGSGRMAQVLPKVDLIDLYNKQWTGLGFLHPELTKSSKLTLINEFYIDYENNQEVATDVEIVPVQIYIHGGWWGLIVHTAFFLGLYFIVARLRYASYYLSALFFCFWLGLGGFASLASFQGQHLVAFAFAVVILANRDTLKGFSRSDIPEKTEDKQLEF